MKYPAICTLFLAMLATANISVAQNSILAGKIDDENKKPIAGATITVTKDGNQVAEMKSDGNGLYSSQLLDAGEYKVSIVANDKKRKTKTITLVPLERVKYYHNFTLNGKKVDESISDKDPFITVKMDSTRQYQRGMDLPVNSRGGFFHTPPPAQTHSVTPGEKVPQSR